jgi:hypothetical protein
VAHAAGRQSRFVAAGGLHGYASGGLGLWDGINRSLLPERLAIRCCSDKGSVCESESERVSVCELHSHWTTGAVSRSGSVVVLPGREVHGR